MSRRRANAARPAVALRRDVQKDIESEVRRESETGATQKRSAQKGAAVSESDERITEQKSESEEIELAADVDELLPPPPMPMRRSACQ